MLNNTIFFIYMFNLFPIYKLTHWVYRTHFKSANCDTQCDNPISNLQTDTLSMTILFSIWNCHTEWGRHENKTAFIEFRSPHCLTNTKGEYLISLKLKYYDIYHYNSEHLEVTWQTFCPAKYEDNFLLNIW